MGFCFGVRRAIDLVRGELRGRGPLESLGAIVHNRQVVGSLEEAGLRVVGSLGEVRGGAVVITSHGVGPEVLAQARARGLEVVDATCPHVRKAQLRAERMAAEGLSVVIYGEAEHPEVQGILGWSRGMGIATLDPHEAAAFVRGRGAAGVMAQTTQSKESFQAFFHTLRDLVADASGQALKAVNTICPPTINRNRAAAELARQVDLVVVVGGRNSANTRRLVDICRAVGASTHHVETAAELDEALFRGRARIGITAGASTPDQAIEEVAAMLAAVYTGADRRE